MKIKHLNILPFIFCIAAIQCFNLSPLHSQTVQIGNQIWDMKNLNVTQFRNGDLIVEAKSNEEWTSALHNGVPAWCNPKDLEDLANAGYGKLYNWHAINDPRGLAPEGFHIPSSLEWEMLRQNLGGRELVGEKIKMTEVIVNLESYNESGGYDEQAWKPCENCSYWTPLQKQNNPCSLCKNKGGKLVKTGKYIPPKKTKVITPFNIGWNGNNESNFCALPCGIRDIDGSFDLLFEAAFWWTSTSTIIKNEERVYVFRISNTGPFIDASYNSKLEGCSVRCIKN